MSEIQIIISASAAAIFGGALFWRAILKNQHTHTGRIVSDLDKLFEKMESVTTSDQPDSVMARLEELEMRFERLHSDSLRYLQSGSQRAKRAEKLLEESELEEELPELNLPVQEPAEAPGASDLDWGKQQLLNSGINPII